MPKQAFFNLEPEKQTEIKRCAMEEFIRFGYRSASTNRIVEDLGISKGSLFYYFEGKEDLYSFLLVQAQSRFVEELKNKSDQWPAELLKRMELLTVESITLYRRFPLEQQMLDTLIGEDITDFQNETLIKLGGESKARFFEILTSVDTSRFRYSLEETLSLILWTYTGIKMEINQSFRISRDSDAIEKQIMPRLTTALKLLAGGIYRDGVDNNREGEQK